MCTRFPETVGRWIIHGGETPADSIGGINLSDWDQRKRSAAQIRLRPILMTTAAMAALYPRFSLGGFVGFFALRGGDIGSASRAFNLAPKRKRKARRPFMNQHCCWHRKMSKTPSRGWCKTSRGPHR